VLYQHVRGQVADVMLKQSNKKIGNVDATRFYQRRTDDFGGHAADGCVWQHD
jgi:hypothetical protein